MLVDTQYFKNTKQLLVSYINSSGRTKVKWIPWETPFKYEICDADDPEREEKYHSWENKPIKKAYCDYPDRYSTYEFLDSLPEEETKEIFEFYIPKTYFIDIETEVIDGFPDPAEAPTMIQSISIVYDDKIILMGLKDLSDEAQKRILDKTNEYFKKFNASYKLKFIKYNSEFDMLYSFFNKFLPEMPCITGWNFLDFDFRFLVNRAKKLTKTVNGTVYHIDPRKCSISNRLNNIWGTDYEIPAHKLVFDYMLLYDALDTSIKVKESKSLDFVSENMLGVKKIEYDGDLMRLYEEDYEKFMYYNAVDSVLVQKIHEKGNYISIIFAIASLARIKAVDVFSYMNNNLGSLAITEGVLRGMFREEENIILFKDTTKNNSGAGRIAGGWVKEPAVGMNRWVACYDFASLYPTTQRQFFIAPENYRGMIDKQDPHYCISMDGKRIKINKEFDVVCVNGSVFRKKKSPTLKMLENVYADRKMNKRKMQAKKLELDEKVKELERLKSMV
jgi:DNA polymerase elongation subunit (family B)